MGKNIIRPSITHFSLYVTFHSEMWPIAFFIEARLLAGRRILKQLWCADLLCDDASHYFWTALDSLACSSGAACEAKW